MTTTVAELIAAARSQVENLSPKQAAEEAASGAPVFVDVREPMEWEHHIEGAVQVPRGLLEFVADPTSPRHNPDLEPSSRVIVYCNSGARSLLAAATLRTLGYQNLANLDGGFTAWKAAGLPIAEHDTGV